MRMHFKQEFVDLVRLFGYSEIPIPEAREKVKPLIDKYGQKLIEAAAEEIIFVDNAATPEVARLTDHARKLAVQILGSPRPTGPAATSPVSQVAAEPLTTVNDERSCNGAAAGRIQSDASPSPSDPSVVPSRKASRRPRKSTK